MWAALAIVGLLSPSFWIERGDRAVLASADLRPLIDADLRRRLTSGLTTTLVLRLDLRAGDGTLVGGTLQVARARWDLWHEQVSTIIDGPDGSRTETYGSVNLFLNAFAQIRHRPVAPLVALDPTLYQLHARLAVNPLSDAQLARMRRWLARSPDGAGLDPLNGTLLGSFVRFFDNLKPGVAERELTAKGPFVRGDRLPVFRIVGPPPPSPTPGPAPPSAPPSTAPSAPSSTAPESTDGTP